MYVRCKGSRPIVMKRQVNRLSFQHGCYERDFLVYFFLRFSVKTISYNGTDLSLNHKEESIEIIINFKIILSLTAEFKST
jgi:hypothetical protein